MELHVQDNRVAILLEQSNAPSADACVGDMVDAEDRCQTAGDELQRGGFGDRPRTMRRVEEPGRPSWLVGGET